MKNAEKLIWHTEKRLIKDLIPTEGNPRQMTEKEAADLKQSLKKFNLVDIPAINLDNRIISGHQRVSILKTEGREGEEIDVRVPNRKLTEAEHREYLLRANRNLGEWNYDLLANFSEEELGSVGFESEELDKIFNLEADEDDFDAEAEAEKIKKPKVKLGDLYQLGSHKLLCGDSTKKEDVERLMGGEKADLIFTDPPYNTGMKAKSDLTRLSHFFQDNLSEKQWIKLIKGYLENAIEFSKINTAFYTFIDWRAFSEIKNIIQNRLKISNLIVWDKIVHGLGSDYKYTYELIIVSKKGNPKIKNRFGEDYQDIWHLQRKVGRNKEHATAKPIELCKKPILHASKRNDIVLDLFGGSGSTLIACEQLNRKCYMSEIDEKYCQVIIDRWQAFTGKTAVKLN